MSIEEEIRTVLYGDSLVRLDPDEQEQSRELAAYVRSKLRELGAEIKNSGEFTVSRSMDPFEGGKREKAYAIYGVVEAAVERMCGKS